VRPCTDVDLCGVRFDLFQGSNAPHPFGRLPFVCVHSRPCFRDSGLGFGVLGLGFGVWSSEFGVWGLGFGVWDLGFGVWSLGFGVQGLVFGFSTPGYEI